MGIVYRARDLTLDRDVAVKLLRECYPADGPAARRFLGEARITSQLQHPGIPAVYQVGSFPDGRPFLAMKLVKGRTLEAQLNDQPTSSPQRGRLLAVFEAVCQAVAYAHAHQVIHRDLKPANVMVGAFGEVQVMDWGLAKVLRPGDRADAADPDATLDTTVRPAPTAEQQTQAGSLLGTPAYMSPEQAIGAVDQIDQRSDVFGLGGILCAILTGQPPFVGGSVEAARQLAARARLDSAFRRLTECGAEPGLVDLCRRCLAPEKSDRPADAGAVAAEVARLRAEAERRAREAELGEARASVRAAEERKHRRMLLLAGGGLVLVLLAGVAGTTIGLLRAEKARVEAVTERDRAARARDLAQDVLDTMTSEVTGDSLATQKHLSREQQQFLKGVLEHYREFANEAGRDEPSRRRAALAARRVGLIEARLGDTRAAVAALQQARQELAVLANDFPAELGYRRALAMTHTDLGNQLWSIGRLDEAEAAHRASAGVLQTLIAEQPEERQHRVNRATTQLNLGNVFARRGQAVAAEKEFLQAQAALQELAAANPGEPHIRQHLATVYDELGNLYTEEPSKGKSAQAEEAYRAGLDLRARLVAEFPDDAEYRLELSGSHNNLGLLLDNLRRSKEAEAQSQAAVRIREKLVAEFPSVPAYRILLGAVYGNVGRLQRRARRPADSLEWFNRGIETLATQHEREPQHEEARRFLRNTHAGRALAFAALGRHTEALQDWDRAIALSQEPEAQRRARASRTLALVHIGRTSEAVAEVALLTKSPGWTAAQLYDFACVCSLASGKDAANRESHAARAVELLRQAIANGWKDVAHLSKDIDLDPLRMRQDFRELLASLQR
jgi:tetratricopeptide (TPR) repeat protein